MFFLIAVFSFYVNNILKCFYFNNFISFYLFLFSFLLFLFLSFLLSGVADRVLVLWLGVRPEPWKWEGQVQDTGPPEPA